MTGGQAERLVTADRLSPICVRDQSGTAKDPYVWSLTATQWHSGSTSPFREAARRPRDQKDGAGEGGVLSTALGPKMLGMQGCGHCVCEALPPARHDGFVPFT